MVVGTHRGQKMSTLTESGARYMSAGMETTMRKLVVLLVALGVLMIPTGALAGAPIVVEDFEFGFGPELEPDISALCGFDVFLEVTGSTKVTVFFDKDGAPLRVQVKERGEAHFTTGHGATAFDRFAFNVVEDFVDGTATLNGNVFNLHASGGGGIVVNDSGQIIFNGELIVHGPHDAFFEDPTIALCAALAP